MPHHRVFAVRGPDAGAADASSLVYPPAWTMLDVTPDHDAAACVREALDAGADLLVACGAIDTVKAVAQGLLHTGVPLAFIPVGAPDGLAAELGLPSDPQDALALAAGDVPADVRTLDVGDAEAGGLFLTRLCIGPAAPGDVVPRASPPRVRYRIRLDGRRPFFAQGVRCVVCNSASPDLGDLGSLPRVRPDDGLLHVVVMRGTGAGALLSGAGEAVRSLFGGRAPGGERSPAGRTWSARQVEIAPEPYQEAACDGSPLQPRFVIRACVHSRALRVLVPAQQNGHRAATAHGLAVQPTDATA